MEFSLTSAKMEMFQVLQCNTIYSGSTLTTKQSKSEAPQREDVKHFTRDEAWRAGAPTAPLLIRYLLHLTSHLTVINPRALRYTRRSRWSSHAVSKHLIILVAAAYLNCCGAICASYWTWLHHRRLHTTLKMATSLQYAPWTTEIDLGFYSALAKFKLENDKLESPVRKVLGAYEVRPRDAPERSTSMQIHTSALTNHE